MGFDTTEVVDVFRTFFYKGFEILLPSLLASMVVVIVFAIIMAVMQIQEQTLTFIPKLLAFVLVLGIAAPWMFDEIVTLFDAHWVRVFTLI